MSSKAMIASDTLLIVATIATSGIQSSLTQNKVDFVPRLLDPVSTPFE